MALCRLHQHRLSSSPQSSRASLVQGLGWGVTEGVHMHLQTSGELTQKTNSIFWKEIGRARSTTVWKTRPLRKGFMSRTYPSTQSRLTVGRAAVTRHSVPLLRCSHHQSLTPTPSVADTNQTERALRAHSTASPHQRGKSR